MARKITFTPSTDYILVSEPGKKVVTMLREDYRFSRVSAQLMQAYPVNPNATDIGMFGWVDVVDPVTADNDALFILLWDMFVPPGGLVPTGDDIAPDDPARITKAVIFGKQDNNSFRPVKSTSEGHLEIAIHAPTNPYRSIHSESLLPRFQGDAVYGVNEMVALATTSLSGTVTASDAMFVLQTGVTIFSQAVIQSKARLRARPGQGGVCRFEARFSPPVALSYQVAGLGHAEDGIFLAYKDVSGEVPDLGILYVNRGVREVQTLTVSVASSTAENVTVTLAGVATLVAVTASGDIQRTVYEVSMGNFPGWAAEAVGATIVFVAESAGNKAGAFTLVGTTAVGAFAETRAGAASTESFIERSSWDGDKLDGTGASGVVLDPSKLNGYEIQCHGPAGPIVFKANVALPGNDHDTVTMHSISFENSRDNPVFANPSFPFTAATYSAGSTSNITMRIGSFSGFLEGPAIMHNPGFSIVRSLATTVGTGAYHAFFTIRNTRYFFGKANQSVVQLQSIFISLNHLQPVVFYIIKGGDLVGNPDFEAHSPTCCTFVDMAATAVLVTSNDQIIHSNHLTNDGNISYSLVNEGIYLQPGEYITIAARAIQGTAADATVSINWGEDQ